jgi:phospholipid/cholesterol/gamma-HCH transport system substrate-binding protein
MRRLLRSRGFLLDVTALLALVVCGLVVGGYILDQQRVRLPILEDAPMRLQAELATAQAVTPGQGQTVRIAGVRIGDIGKVELEEGRAKVELLIDREFDDVIRTDATALLRPRTGLKDMFLEVNPGTPTAPVAREGWTMPVSNTLPDVNPDEFLAGLDADVRDHLKVLLAGASDGLRGRSDDLRQVLKRFEPTHRALARVNGTVKTRRRELRRLISSLAAVNREVASRDDDLSDLVQQSSRVFRALASEQDNVAATIRELPSALRATRSALEEADKLGQELGPAVTRLQPVPAALRSANAATTPYALEAAPLLRRDIRPFVREARPLVRDLRPAVADLAAAEPGLTRTLGVLNHLVNMLAYNPGGREGPDKAGRMEGFLFHLGWLGHQSTNLFSNADAHGVFRPVLLSGPCQTLESTVSGQAPFDQLLGGLTGVLSDQAVCGGSR